MLKSYYEIIGIYDIPVETKLKDEGCIELAKNTVKKAIRKTISEIDKGTHEYISKDNKYMMILLNNINATLKDNNTDLSYYNSTIPLDIMTDQITQIYSNSYNLRNNNGDNESIIKENKERLNFISYILKDNDISKQILNQLKDEINDSTNQKYSLLYNNKDMTNGIVLNGYIILNSLKNKINDIYLGKLDYNELKDEINNNENNILLNTLKDILLSLDKNSKLEEIMNIRLLISNLEFYIVLLNNYDMVVFLKLLDNINKAEVLEQKDEIDAYFNMYVEYMYQQAIYNNRIQKKFMNKDNNQSLYLVREKLEKINIICSDILENYKLGDSPKMYIDVNILLETNNIISRYYDIYDNILKNQKKDMQNSSKQGSLEPYRQLNDCSPKQDNQKKFLKYNNQEPLLEHMLKESIGDNWVKYVNPNIPYKSIK